MKFPLVRENIRIALQSISTQILRTVLTVLIIGIGIMALVGILSSVKALENTIASNFSSMGSNTFGIQRQQNTFRAFGRGERQKINPVIDYRQAKEFIENYNFPLTQVSISFTATASAEVKFENQKTDPEILVLGITENSFNNRGYEIEEGREFNYFDISNNSNVCVIGQDLKNGLLKNVNPINKIISVRGAKFKIIGVLKKSNSGDFGSNDDNNLYIPIQQARTLYPLPNVNYGITIKADNPEIIDNAVDDAKLVFRNIRGLTPLEEDNFSISRSDDLINRISSISQYLYYAAWIISIITIFGSTIALMNIMLVSVSERTREIGVRKALGAKPRTIANQFIIETIIIGQMGGIAGIVLGILIGLIFASALNLEFTIPWFAMISASIITFVVAIISGSYPAAKASKLDPIESLRYE